MAASLKQALVDELATVQSMDESTLLERRYQRLRRYGAYQG